MGRNGKNESAFTKMINFVNANVGKVVASCDILVGKKPGRNAETSYIYKFLKLGYTEILDNKTVMDPSAKYKILKAFPANYNSVIFGDEMRILKGLKPKYIIKK